MSGKAGTPQVPGWPLLVAVIGEDGSATVDGVPVGGAHGPDGRAAAIAHAAATAGQLGRAVRVELADAEGLVWLLAVAPDGTESVLSAPEQPGKGRRKGKAKGKTARPGPERTPVGGPQSAAPSLAELFGDPADGPAATGTGPSPLTESPVAPAATTAPPEHGSSALGDALTARDWRTADRLAAERLAESGSTPEESALLRELHARIALLGGDPATAVERYRALAADLASAHGAEHPGALAAFGRAREAWEQVADRDTAVALGRDLLALGGLVPDAPGAARLRARLARLHLSG
ncbi:hypothetical protein [Kitasatospora sp. KL5]|uniref:hypothetical protein n=1 Tax=Kitasatospora sp. KL5 TaxID=3425125 RepID=UPI003D6DEB75